MFEYCPRCGETHKIVSLRDIPVTLVREDCGVAFDGVRHWELNSL